jgi:uncharacterized protein (TIGR00255 family)
VIRSMTGFGRGSAGEGATAWVVTVQGWNHRHADLQLRLPDELRDLEPELRARLQGRVARGRCEVQFRRAGEAGEAPALRLDRGAVERFLGEVSTLAEAGLVDRRITAGDLSRSPFLVRGEAAAESPEAERAALVAAFDVAVEAFDADRRREGGELAASLRSALGELESIVAELAARRVGWTSQLVERVRQRLDEILPGGAAELPADRLAQEVVLLSDRSDVSEELDRLGSHLRAYDEVVGGAGPHGRRLDFWSQEVLRELNTLGSKSRDAAVTRWVVDAKVVNERFREQVQNVE